MNQKRTWIRIALVNLCLVAFTGLLLRSKMLFPIPFLDFKHTLHAHSHFAFGGWISISLMALMTSELLPRQQARRPVYAGILTGMLISAIGMLFTFMAQGYAFWSILFSTLFLIIGFAYCIVFTRDLLQTKQSQQVTTLSVGALICFILSSAGPFTLAWLMASKSGNVILYKNAIYTYLHLQYSGFFTLSVFALFLSRMGIDNRPSRYFSRLVILSVIPSMFISYLWHVPGIVMELIALSGSLLLLAASWALIQTILSAQHLFRKLRFGVKITGALAITCFLLKNIFQSLTIIPVIGSLTFTNRPLIIGFLHLVLLGFVSLYLLTHFLHARLIPETKAIALSIGIFIAGIFINETVLMTQGLYLMLGKTSVYFPWLLWTAGLLLFTGSLMTAIAATIKQKPITIRYQHPHAEHTVSISIPTKTQKS